MKWYYVAIGIALLLLICRSDGKPAVRVKKEQCIDANVFSDTWGMPVPCGDEEEPDSLQDHEEPIRAGGATSEAGFSLNPTGAGVYITYDKT